MTARTLLVAAAFLALLVSLVLMVLDDPAPEPSDVRRQMPVTIDGVDGFRCDFTIESNGVRADTAHASCEEETP